MSSPSILLRVPSKPGQQIILPYISEVPAALGRTLRNGTTIVKDDAVPASFYKFVPWERSVLASNELDTYAKLNTLDNLSGIARLLGVSATRSHLVQKMEYAQHGSLDKFLFEAVKGDHQRMSAGLVRSILLQIAEGMMKIHALDLIHRDIKAENILVFDAASDSATVQAKVTDFDRAVELARDDYLQEPVGSMLHMAPELLVWGKYNRKIDVYAYGILMFEVAHGGTTPYPNVGTGMPDSIPRTEFAQKIVDDNFRPEWLHSDTALQELAARCWAKNPDDRPEFVDIVEILKADAAWQSAAPLAGLVQSDTSAKRLDGVGIASDIGKQRSKMEDAVCVLDTQDARIACVFDGLRDYRTSEFAARRLALTLSHELGREAGDAAADEAALRRAFALVEQSLQSLQPPIECGSTAVVTVLRPQELLVAWLGDSPAYLIRKTQVDTDFSVLDMINEHQPDRADEALRIAANDGVVGREQRWLDSGEAVPFGPARVFFSKSNESSGIALSRALGLFAFKPAISSEPELLRLKRQEDDLFLVLGSDGIFDFLDMKTVVETIVNADSVQHAADAILSAVLKLGAPDNASVVVVDVRLAVD